MIDVSKALLTEQSARMLIGGICIAFIIAILRVIAKTLTRKDENQKSPRTREPTINPYDQTQAKANKTVGVKDPLHGMFAKTGGIKAKEK